MRCVAEAWDGLDTRGQGDAWYGRASLRHGQATKSDAMAWQSIEIICSGGAVSSTARLEKAWI